MPYKEWKEQKEAQKRHYQKNKDYYKQKRVEREQKIKDWVASYKSERGCSRCDESHISCLEFHHRDQSEKEINVYKAIKNGWGIARLKIEIDKCDVVCANCHRKIHYNDGTVGKNMKHRAMEQSGSSPGS